MGSIGRAANKAAIRQALATLGPTNVAEIATETGLSRSVVRRWLGALVIERKVERLDGPGYPQYQLREDR